MVFESELLPEQLQTLRTIRKFAKEAHKESNSHDFAHVLTVCRTAIQIAKKVEDKVDPFEVIAAALLHDIGKTNSIFAHMHGLLGGALAEEFLDGVNVEPDKRDRICRAIIRHTPTTKLPPETPLEKIIFDADLLDRLGLMGLIRGFIGKKGSMDSIMNTYMERREKDFPKLNYDISREMGDAMNEELEAYIMILRHRLELRMKSIQDIFIDEGLDTIIKSK